METTENVNRPATVLNRVRDNPVLLAAALAVVLALILTLLPQSPLYETQTDTLPVQAHVMSPARTDLGVVNDPGLLHFGRLRPGVSSTKILTLQNGDQTTRATVTVDGNASRFVAVSDRSLVLRPGETRDVRLTFNATEPGRWDGTATVQKHTAAHAMLSPLLRVLP